MFQIGADGIEVNLSVFAWIAFTVAVLFALYFVGFSFGQFYYFY
jgi:hypothetical protein